MKHLFMLMILFLFCLMQATASSNSINQQQKVVKGVIADKQTGEPLVGVNIISEGTKIGTLTDLNGNFTIKVLNEKSVLKLSYIGYETQKFTVGNQTNVKLFLSPDSKNIEEIVILGFGSQKKINLVGSISTVEPKKLVSASVANITTALIGNAPGVTGLQTSGESGRSGTSIFIRGRSTFNDGGSDPLIVIDGIEQASEQAYSQLNSMDPNEIAAVSILKDASSTAVYGIRGANGVIIVTTKKGTVNKPVISFSANYGSTSALNVPKMANAYDWGRVRNEAVGFNSSQMGDHLYDQYIFTDDELWKMQNGRDYTDAEIEAMTQLSADQKASLKTSAPIWYGSNDFIKEAFGNKGPQTQYNLNISGGTEKVRYFTSFGYFNQGSILGNTKYENVDVSSTYNRYNFRSNFEFHPTKNLDIVLSMSGQFNSTKGSAGISSVQSATTDMSARYKSMMGYLMNINPLITPYLIDGKLVKTWAGAVNTPSYPIGNKIGPINAYNPSIMILDGGEGYLYNNLLSNSIKITHRLDYITDGLSIRGTLNYDDNYTKTVYIDRSFPMYSITRDMTDPNKLVFYGGGQGAVGLTTNLGAGAWNKTYFDAGIDYVKAFGDHHITLLALGKASIYKLPTNDSYNTPSGIMGLVGRATYNYADKYLAEFSMGYNGTEQFAKGNQFGFFPAFSLGWVISNEKFFQKPEWVDLLKLRGSYGIVGSDYLGGSRYLYLPNTYVGSSWYNFGSSNGSTANPGYAGTTEGKVGNPLVTWEKSTKQGVGFDARFFKDKLSMTVDLFSEVRDNILIRSGLIPSTYGVLSGNLPPVNLGKTSNHGYEFSMGWDDKIGDFGYSLSGSFSYARNKADFKAEAANPYPWMNLTGLTIGQYMGLKSDGFFNTPEELANRPYNTYSSNKEVLGDIKYKDLNGDGLIDYKDVAPIGYNNLPEYSYNFKVGFNYKGFDVNTLFIGTLHGSYYLPTNYTQAFNNIGGGAFQYQIDDRWTPEKVANGTPIFYPRPQIEYSNQPNFTPSDFWIRSTDFLRLKNMEIGYTVPRSLLKQVNISSLRVYANGNNLWTNKTALDKYGIDPETTDRSSSYLFPLTQAFIMGINVTF